MYTLGHTLLPKQPTILPTRVGSTSQGRRSGACRRLPAPLSLLVLQAGAPKAQPAPPGRFGVRFPALPFARHVFRAV